jgi:gamma-glutamyltranspeptidase / glutathione hydrolase
MAQEDPTLGAAIQNPSWRPTVIGRQYAVSCGHYLASVAALQVLQRGGNAIDAGVTAAMALAVLQPDMVSFAGVAPTLIYHERENKVVSLAGLGYWPAATDKARLIEEGNGRVPEGLLRTVMPAAPATHIEALRRYGTITFEEAATPAMQLARDGFAVYPVLAGNTRKHADKYRRWPTNAEIFLPGGEPPQLGTLFRQTDLAKTMQAMIEAERSAGSSRERGLQAVHDYFYRGPVADAVHDFHVKHGGFMRRSDMEAYSTPVEESIRCTYKGYEIHACDVWCQGIVLLQTLKMLEGVDLKAMGHNSPAYVHTITEALKLAFADREAYVGDPKFVRVPTREMVSAEYAQKQRARIDPDRAEPGLPAPGLPHPEIRPYVNASFNTASGPSRTGPDTIYCCVIDAEGNAYSATLSDNSRQSPVIPGTGMIISCRGSQSRLEPGHPSEVAPGKRPRLTPNPALAFKDGKLLMAWGTPGGDVQTQAMLQTFLNVVEWNMPLQQAIEAPRFASFSFPGSFAPYDYLPGRLNVEGRFPESTVTALRTLGHDVEVWPDIVSRAGAICAVKIDPDTGLRHAGADPRREAYALAW